MDEHQLSPAEVRAILIGGGSDIGLNEHNPIKLTIIGPETTPPPEWALRRHTGRCLYCGHQVGQPCVCAQYGHTH